jgi:hypothetical protein
MAQKISHSTPMTTAIALALCSGAFWIGTETAHLDDRISVVEKREAELRADSKAWRGKFFDLMNELKDLSRDNKHRMDLFEKANR